ncbi:hypothetical protein CLV28_1174 [Sediminihabitans luteus]|uniref:BMP family ABC transporter substrate-binding protein n=1 Tax=Sediminihabitans luteus TaxID=1138585 RepID=A0A2M9D1D5_9CELL|nr:hypothetical protein [Sediminihabitans luteus]PJJ77947.1 hypothetical protein CLV28_1174 [Sediminihabitans luteus]GII99695.1 hypothetical protein Slu03_20730 [Sediminihabitans luteus]
MKPANRWATAGGALVLGLALAGCGAGTSPVAFDPARPGTVESTLADPAQPDPGPAAPVPGATLAPSDVDKLAGAAPAGGVAAGLELVVALPAAPDAATSVLADAVDDWAAAHDATTRPVVVRSFDDLQAVADDATDAIVVVPGDALVDEVDVVSAQNLGVPFLMLGAQVLEPTDNVTAVVWSGASSRGSAAAADQPSDDASVTPARAAEAVEVGTRGVLRGVQGVVVALG